MTDEHGGYAFPIFWGEGQSPSQGMTLRDWFAGQAMAGILAKGGGETWEADAAWAWRAADAMIAERDRK